MDNTRRPDRLDPVAIRKGSVRPRKWITHVSLAFIGIAVTFVESGEYHSLSLFIRAVKLGCLTWTN